MKGFERLMMGFFVLALMFCGFSAYAEETGSGQAAKSGWEFDVVPYFWMAGLGGEVKARGREADMSAGFSDIWDNLEFGAQVHMEARKGKWSIFSDVTYLDISNGKEVIRRQALGPVEGKVDITEWLVELGGVYQAAKWSFDKGSSVALDVLGGGRYWNVKSELTLSHPDLNTSRSASSTKEWVDPFVGARVGIDLGRNFLLALRGDIGGFGVGTDFTWNASVVLGYQITRLLSAWIGYRALGLNADTGSGDDKIEYDIVMHGPMIGMGFSF